MEEQGLARSIGIEGFRLSHLDGQRHPARHRRLQIGLAGAADARLPAARHGHFGRLRWRSHRLEQKEKDRIEAEATRPAPRTGLRSAP